MQTCFWYPQSFILVYLDFQKVLVIYNADKKYSVKKYTANSWKSSGFGLGFSHQFFQFPKQELFSDRGVGIYLVK